MTQKTIRRIIRLEGAGIHSGKPVKLSLHPSPVDDGIVFRRTDLQQDILCSPGNVSNLRRSVGLSQDGASVNTVEHLLAALMMTGVTNLRIELDAEELPFLDGAAFLFVKSLLKAGIIGQGKEINPLIPSSPLTVREGGDFISVVPLDKLVVTCFVNFPHPMLKNRFFTFDFDREDPVKSLSKARTFGFEKEIKSLHESGLGLGGTLENALVFSETGVLNPNQNYPDEAVRHKILDFIGDMYLSGRPFKGYYILYKNGHKLDHRFLQTLLST